MKVEIIDFELADKVVLDACLERVRRWSDNTDMMLLPCEIHCVERRADGLLEYMLKLIYPVSNGHMWVGAVQRQPGAEVEFHS